MGPLAREAGLAVSIRGKTLPLCSIASPLPRNFALSSAEVKCHSTEGLDSLRVLVIDRRVGVRLARHCT